MSAILVPSRPTPVHAVLPKAVSRAFSCRCGRPVFFHNSICLGCSTPLGYDPARQLVLPLVAAADSRWHEARAGSGNARPVPGRGPAYRRCANLDTPPACNWLLGSCADDAGQTLCRCCRLTRTVPDLSVIEHALWWQRIELAKRRLVSSLVGLRLPLKSRVSEDIEQGLAFDLLRSSPGGSPVVTGHADGVITLDIEEADDARREQRRNELREPYRTLLGHLRHESGHYYWYRLVGDSDWLAPWREQFGDERQDYAAALQRHHDRGPAADWRNHYVSAYASSHPWEDWAETWAHYLHMVDTLGTAASFGMQADNFELYCEPFGADVLGDWPATAHSADFLKLVNRWVLLSSVLNELSRAMGLSDFYPFVLPAPVVCKLYFVHWLIVAGRLR